MIDYNLYVYTDIINIRLPYVHQIVHTYLFGLAHTVLNT